MEYLACFCCAWASLCIVIAAAGLWLTAGKENNEENRKYRDKQTLLAGALWSQTIIPIGLIIGAIVDDNIDLFISLYFVAPGALILITTGIIFIVGESVALAVSRASIRTDPPNPRLEHLLRSKGSKQYLVIGILCVLAGLVKTAEAVLWVYFVLIT